jgi:exodeoxyribonuclease VII large subunit
MAYPARPLTISELTQEIREVLEENFFDVTVTGELSNVTKHASGHVYFSLKDEQAQISGVMFKGNVARSQYKAFQEGQRVVARGSISVYPPRGSYQLVVKAISPAGLGDLYLQFEALKNKLTEEGLFDASRKRALPAFPSAVAVITSPTGAVIRDIIQTVKRRFPPLQLLLIPATVQGTGAEQSLMCAIQIATQIADISAIILARGGGSMEDLWCFNSEALARVIAACPIPVVSAIGHETDFTIADFVADVRAPTPTAAAEMLTPHQDELKNQLTDLAEHLNRFLYRQLQDEQLNLSTWQDRLAQAVQSTIDIERQNCLLQANSIKNAASEVLLKESSALEVLRHQLVYESLTQIQHQKSQLAEYKAALMMHDIQQTFERGFSLSTINGMNIADMDINDSEDAKMLETHYKHGVLLSQIFSPSTTKTQ